MSLEKRLVVLAALSPRTVAVVAGVIADLAANLVHGAVGSVDQRQVEIYPIVADIGVLADGDIAAPAFDAEWLAAPACVVSFGASVSECWMAR